MAHSEFFFDSYSDFTTSNEQTTKQMPAQSYVASTNGTSDFCCNQQYSVTAITTAAGAIAERYAYTAYGLPTILNASATIIATSAISNRYTYTGREWDATLGLHHFRARWMSPIAGRFLGRDPIKYGTEQYSLFEYVTAKCVTRVDPFGLYGLSDLGPCIWWIRRYYLGGDNDVDLQTFGLFDEWRYNIGVDQPIQAAKGKVLAKAEKLNLSCDGQTGLISTVISGSMRFDTQVAGVPLCSRIGPIGGSRVQLNYSCEMTADCDECPDCPDVYDVNAVLPKVTCNYDFVLEDQFSNPGDLGGAHNKPRDLAGFQKCMRHCRTLRGRPASKCITKCRKKFLLGNMVPVITDPTGYPYFIRAKWNESESSYGAAVSCGSRPTNQQSDDE